MVNITRIEISLDYETSEMVGESGLFQINWITGYSESDENLSLTGLIDQGDFYDNANEVLKDIKLNSDEYSSNDCGSEIDIKNS